MRGLVAFGIFFLVPPFAPANEDSFAIRGVTVIDGTGAEPAPDRAIVIERDRIVAILPSAELSADRVDRIVDANDQWMIPGMWDMHVHVQELSPSQLPVFLANGVTGVRDMGGEPDVVFKYRDAIESGSIIGPRILAAGYMITNPSIAAAIESMSTPEQWKIEQQRRLVVRTEEEAHQAVEKILDSGADFIKLHWNESPTTYAAIGEAASNAGLRFVGHDPLGQITIDQWLEHGQHSIEHIDGSFGRQLAARTSEAQEQWMEEAANAGLHFVPTLLLAPKLASLSSAKTPTAKLQQALDHPQAAYVPERLLDFWKLFFQLVPVEVPGLQAFKRETIFLAGFHETGIRIMPGTDLGVPLVFPGWSLIEELQLFVEVVGMTPHEAIQSATRVPAEFFDLDSDLGTIEVGKIADLVLLRDNPLASVDALRTVTAVVCGGIDYSRSELDELLEAARVPREEK